MDTMMSTLIDTKTLTNLRRHLKGIAALSQMMQGKTIPMVINKMLFLDEKSDPIDIVQSFESDLGTTAQMLKNTAIAMTSLDGNGISKELSDDVICDFNRLFPDHYDNENKTLKLFGVSINAGKSTLSADEWKESLYAAMLSDQPVQKNYQEYRKHLSIIKTLESTSRPGRDAPIHESLHYATLLVSVDKNHNFYDTLLKLADKYVRFRRELTEKNRELLDDRIVGSRAMIDGVVKSSTYLEPGNIIQLSSKHKSEVGILDKITELLKDVPSISHVEIDQDADVVKVHDTIIDIKNMSIDVPDAFIFKVRRLGNYGACGLASTQQVDGTEVLSKQFGFTSNQLRIVAVDVEHPTSLAHEIVHFRDQNRDDPIRNAFVKHFSKKMDTNIILSIAGSSGRFNASYFTNDAEVLARLGEIGFLLNQHNYQQGESISAFSERARHQEIEINPLEGKLKYQVNLVKNIDTYLGKEGVFSQQIHFNLAQWSEDELSMVKDYTRDFFYKNDPEIRKALEARIARGELAVLELAFRNRQKKEPRRTRPLSDNEKINHVLAKMEPGDLVDAYVKSVNEHLISDGELPFCLIDGQMRLFDGGGARTAGKANRTLILKQFDEMSNLAQAMSRFQRHYDQMALSWVIENSIKSDLGHHVRRNLPEIGQIHPQKSDVYHLFEATVEIQAALKRMQISEDENVETINSLTPPKRGSHWITQEWPSSTVQPIIGKLNHAVVTLNEALKVSQRHNDRPEDIPDMFVLPHLIENRFLTQKLPDTTKAVYDFVQEATGKQAYDILTDIEKVKSILLRTSIHKAFDGQDQIKKLISTDKNTALQLARNILSTPEYQGQLSDSPLVSQRIAGVNKESARSGNTKVADVVFGIFEDDLTGIKAKKHFGYNTVDPFKRLAWLLTGGTPDKLELFIKTSMDALSTPEIEKSLADNLSEELLLRLKTVQSGYQDESVNHPVSKIAVNILFSEEKGVKTASDTARYLAKSHFVKTMVDAAADKSVYISNRSSYDSYGDIAEFLAEHLSAITEVLQPDGPLAVNKYYHFEKVQAYTDEGKRTLQQWVAEMDKINPGLTPVLLKFIQNKTFGQDLSPSQSSTLNKSISEMKAKSATILLPLAINNELFKSTGEIVQNVRDSFSANYLEQDNDIVNPPKPTESSALTAEFEPEEVEPSSIEYQNEYLIAVNQDVKPADNGLPGKKQQLKMF